MNTKEYIIVHHTLVSRHKNKAQFDAVNKYHKSRGFPKSSLGYYVGYHYMIEPDGKVIKAREHDDIGAHTVQQSMNYRSLGICLSGHFDIEEPTDEQKSALLDLILELQKAHNIPDGKIKLHRDYAGQYKSCPGTRIPNDIKGYLELADDVPDWGQDAWNWGKQEKITDGSRPNDPVTRVEVMTLLYRVFNLVIKTVKDLIKGRDT